MLLVYAKLWPSLIHGLGVFATYSIPEGTRVQEFNPKFDRSFTSDDILDLPPEILLYFYANVWRSYRSGRYCLFAGVDNYINHSEVPNLRVVPCSGGEHFSVANRKILRGEELTVDYREFDWVDMMSGNLWDRMREKIPNADYVLADHDKFDELFYLVTK